MRGYDTPFNRLEIVFPADAFLAEFVIANAILGQLDVNGSLAVIR
jgi:hypothetical protein